MITIMPNVFWMAKDELAPQDWEDAGGFDMQDNCYAVADGASAAYRAREWATQLVTHYVREPPAAAANGDAAFRWFSRCAEGWQVANADEEVEWYHREAAKRGSFAAFLGVRLVPTGAGFRWNAIAVGDSCLLHIRESALAKAFPLANPADFNQSPDLVPSSTSGVEKIHGKVMTSSGDAVPGDLLLMCTDALAKVLLEEADQGEPLWTAITSFSDNSDFARFIRYLRNENAIAIDDVTLLRLVVTWAS